jgi:hypothetical protein
MRSTAFPKRLVREERVNTASAVSPEIRRWTALTIAGGTDTMQAFPRLSSIAPR